MQKRANGALPEAGGLFDQPAVLMEILSTIDLEVEAVQEHEKQQAEDKAKQKTATDELRKGRGGR